MNLQTKKCYNNTFFDSHLDGSIASARAVVPIVLRLSPASSVVDFGCARGAWLKACVENGVRDVLGLDGDYVDRDKLLIDRGCFRAVNLSRPFRLERRFDLALCMEVAEHLPARSAPEFIGSLVAAAPVVLFSAALPGQGGTSHLNEQWPSYWEDLFVGYGMRKYDVIRPLIWSDHSIDWFYRQNIYLFSSGGSPALSTLESFEPEFSLIGGNVMNSLQMDARFPLRSRYWKLLNKLRRRRSNSHGPA